MNILTEYKAFGKSKLTTKTKKPSNHHNLAAEKTTKTALLVLGMHRSGTSPAARLLSLAGASLPRNLIGLSEDNVKGHWESKPIAVYNDELMQSLGVSWSTWQPVNLTKLPLGERHELKNSLREIVEQEFGTAPLIVLKEPRICRLADTYISALQDAGFNVVVVIPFRNPSDVIDSLMSRPSWPAEKGELDAALLWLAHVLEAEKASRGMPRAFWNFQALFSDWQTMLQQVAQEADIRFPVSAKNMEKSVAEFLDRNEQHHHNKSTAGRMNLGWLREAYDALMLLTQDANLPHALDILDMLRRNLQDSRTVLEAAQIEKLQHFEAAAALAATTTDLEGDLAKERKTATELHSAKVELEQNLESERQTAVALNAAKAELEQNLESERQTAVALNAAKVELEQNLESARQTAVALNDTKTKLEEDIETAAQVNEVLTREMISIDEAFRRSRSWRLTAPLRAPTEMLVSLQRNYRTMKRAATIRGSVFVTGRAALAILRREGVSGLKIRFVALHSQRYAPEPITNTEKPDEDFINSVIPDRKHILMSESHIALTKAIWEDRPPAAQGETLGLSLVTYNSIRWLPGFFASLEAQSFPLSRINLVFVDNGSTDGTQDFLAVYMQDNKSKFASLQIHERSNAGFGAGHDFAIRQCRDDFVLVSNLDIEFHEHTLSRCLRAAMADSTEVGSWELRQCPYEHPKYYDPVTLETSWSSHACILMRRSAYIDVGGYEKNIFMYGEDVELSYRMRGNGLRLRYLPQVSVTHFVDLTDTTTRPNQLSGSLSANVLLRHRYGGPERAAEGERLLQNAAEGESEPDRIKAFSKAILKVETDRDHFANTNVPKIPSAFPFRGFDYDVCRDGHDIVLQSADVLSTLPLVSIITRTHGEKTDFLKEAMASVINQSYRNIEHIIVEDRTDFAQNIVEAARDGYKRNIKYVKSDGAGRSEAGNFGLAAATGEYLLFLDNDDLLFADHVELLVRTLAQNTNHVAAYGLGWNASTDFSSNQGYREVMHSVLEGHRLDYSRHRLQNMNFIPIQCILFRRSVYDTEGGFDVSIDHLEDWNLWARYSMYGDFAFVSKLTSVYRTPNSLEINRSRQSDLDLAYESVQKKNIAAGKKRRSL